MDNTIGESTDPNDWNERGKELYQRGCYDDAIKMYCQALRLQGTQTDLSRYASNLAQVQFQLRNYSQVIQYADIALEYNPQNTKALIRRGLANEHIEQFDRALADLNQALKDKALSPSMQTLVVSARRRIQQNQKKDRLVAAAELDGCGNLVHENQALRLNFRSPLPLDIGYDVWIPVHVYLANEFGLYNRKHFSNSSNDDLEIQVTLRAPPSSASSSDVETSVLQLRPSTPLVIPWSVGKTAFHFKIQNNAKLKPSSRLQLEIQSRGSDIVGVASLPFTLAGPSESSLTLESSSAGGSSCRIIQVDGLSRDLVLLEAPGTLGIGGKLWDSSFVLAKYLTQHATRLLHEGTGCSGRVIELGSGLGLTGLVCAALGASHVMMTDIEDVVGLLRQNIRLNFNRSSHPHLCAETLMWGQAWPVDLVDMTFDLVLCSDVVYDPTLYTPLLDTLRLVFQTHGAKKGVMAHRSRHPEDPSFFRQFQEQFKVEEISTFGLCSMMPMSSDVRLFEFHPIE